MFKENELRLFVYWITERHNIYMKRQQGLPKPWTEDPILQTYRFCNVFRELDTTTIWIKENIREKYKDHKYMWFGMCVARQINKIETLAELGDLVVDFNPEQFEAAMKTRRARGDLIYSPAYMLTTHKCKMDKIEYTTMILNNVWKDRESITEYLNQQPDLQSAFNLFLQYHGFGKFVSYEVVTDLRHTHYLYQASDIYTWANSGPGAIRGLWRLQGLDYTKPMKQPMANNLMQQLLEHVTAILDMKLEMRDIEHSLCEFDKMMRVINQQGRPKQLYDGRG